MTEKILYASASDLTPDFTAIEQNAIRAGRRKLAGKRAAVLGGALAAVAAAAALLLPVLLRNAPAEDLAVGAVLDELADEAADVPDRTGLILSGASGCGDYPREEVFFLSSAEELRDDVRFFFSVSEAEKELPKVREYPFGYSFAGYALENPDEAYQKKTRERFFAFLGRLSVTGDMLTETDAPDGFCASYPALLPAAGGSMPDNTYFEVRDRTAADGNPVFYIQANVRGTVVCCSATRLAIRPNEDYESAETLAEDPFFAALVGLCGFTDVGVSPLRDTPAPAYGFYDREQGNLSDSGVSIRYAGGVLTAYFPGEESAVTDAFPAEDLNEALRAAVKEMKDAGFGGIRFVGGRFVTAATADGRYGVPCCRFYFFAEAEDEKNAPYSDEYETVSFYYVDAPAYQF